MVKKSRTGVLVGLALLVGVAAGAVGMLSLRGGDGPYASAPARATRSMGGAPETTAFITAVSGNCEMNPVLPGAGAEDGHEQLQAKAGAASPDEVASLILSGKEAAASGHRRDAEIEFLNACRNAAALQDGDPIPLADAMYQLARLYANVSALGEVKDKQLYPRAERLYSASLEAYRARYGENSEKTRFAREGLITVQQATGGKPPTAIAKTSPPPATAPVAAASATAPVAAASAPAPVAAASSPAPVVAAGPVNPAEEKSATPVTKAEPERKPQPRRRSVREEPPLPAPIIVDGDAPRSRDDTASMSLPQPEVQAPRVRRAAPRSEESDVSVDALPPPRRARVAPPAVEWLPAPDTSGSGAGPAQAEGSPNAQ